MIYGANRAGKIKTNLIFDLRWSRTDAHLKMIANKRFIIINDWLTDISPEVSKHNTISIEWKYFYYKSNAMNTF